MANSKGVDKATIEPRPVGRPRTTLADLPEDWENIMLECGEVGGSEVEMRVLLSVGEAAFSTLTKDYTEFSRTRKRSKDLCNVWWEKRGREMATGEDGNPTVWIFNMKNRFGWRDKTEVDQTISGTTTVNSNVTIKGDDITDYLKSKHSKE